MDINNCSSQDITYPIYDDTNTFLRSLFIGIGVVIAGSAAHATLPVEDNPKTNSKNTAAITINLPNFTPIFLLLYLLKMDKYRILLQNFAIFFNTTSLAMKLS